MVRFLNCTIHWHKLIALLAIFDGSVLIRDNGNQKNLTHLSIHSCSLSHNGALKQKNGALKLPKSKTGTQYSPTSIKVD